MYNVQQIQNQISSLRQDISNIASIAGQLAQSEQSNSSQLQRLQQLEASAVQQLQRIQQLAAGLNNSLNQLSSIAQQMSTQAAQPFQPFTATQPAYGAPPYGGQYGATYTGTQFNPAGAFTPAGGQVYGGQAAYRPWPDQS